MKKKKKISAAERDRRYVQSLQSQGRIRFDENNKPILFHYEKKSNGYRVESWA